MSGFNELFDQGRKDGESGVTRIGSQAQDWRYQEGKEFGEKGWTWGKSSTSEGNSSSEGYSSLGMGGRYPDIRRYS